MEKDLEKGKTTSLPEMEAILISKGFTYMLKCLYLQTNTYCDGRSIWGIPFS